MENTLDAKVQRHHIFMFAYMYVYSCIWIFHYISSFSCITIFYQFDPQKADNSKYYVEGWD